MPEDQHTSEFLIAGFKKMVEQEIVIAPWLALDRDDGQRLNTNLRRELKRYATELANVDKTAQIIWLSSWELTQDARERVFFETVLSTAAYLSYMRLGTLVITEEMASVAKTLLREYIAEIGSSMLLSIHARVMTYLNTQLILYYGRVAEDIFVSGKWHRPWIDYPLDRELELALHYNFFERKKRGRKVFLQLTTPGEELHKACKDDLEQCGFVRQREHLMRVASFTSMDDYEKILEGGNPEIHIRRKKLLEWSGIGPAMKVLELGCGSGALTLDDGLCDIVGPHGKVVATDPSSGMLERAKVKLSNYNTVNLTFKQASAESIPFSDNTFDAVTGMMFLHFADIPKAFKEIRRVLRPGGTFSTLLVLELSRRDEFFIEWFEPVFKRGLVADNTPRMPSPDTVPGIAGKYFDAYEYNTEEWILNLMDVEAIVKFLVEAGTIAELNDLPMQARLTLFQELIERGKSVKEKYGAEQMKQHQLVQWFKGTVVK